MATLSNSNEPIVVEVFKTSVKRKEDAARITRLLNEYFPHHAINFDLEDCDKILRVEGMDLNHTFIKNAVGQLGFSCEILV